MLTSADIAKIVGISDRTIRDWISKGIIPKSDDLTVVVPAIINHYKSEAKKAREKNAGTDDLIKEKIRLTSAQADKVELEIAEKEGELVNARATTLIWSNYILACRAKLLGMPAKLAYELSGITEAKTIQEILTITVDEALQELGDESFARGAGFIDTDSESIQAATETEDL